MLASDPVVANTEFPPGHTDAGVAPVLVKVIDEDKEIVAVATELHPFTSVPVTVYTVVALGLAFTLDPLVEDRPDAGAHE